MTQGANGWEARRDVSDPRAVLEPVAAVLRAAGFYAYTTLDAENRWSVACDTDEGHVDVRVGDDGYELDVWDTSPGLFMDDENERRREARERLARVSLPAIARGLLEPAQDVWWDEGLHGVGVRLRCQVPFALRDEIGRIAKERLARLNAVIGEVEARLME
ncbi:MAG: hypothetical protein QJR03_09890 [Sphaerobacter sp.]|nr:hypothetical protein [Sphaerobacter sp.]